MTSYRLKGLAERIKELRLIRGWSQEQLAEKVGVSRPAVTQWESGDTKNIKNETLIALSHAFEMSVDELLTGQPPMYIAEPTPHYADNITQEEQTMLDKFRHLDDADRKRIQAILLRLMQKHLITDRA